MSTAMTLNEVVSEEVMESRAFPASQEACDDGPDEHYIAAMLVALDVVSESLSTALSTGQAPEFTARRVAHFRSAWLEARRLVARGEDAARLERFLARVG